MQDYSDIWNAVLSEIQTKVSPTAFNLWFKDLELILVVDNIAIVNVQTVLKKEMIEKHNKEILVQKLSEILNYDLDIVFVSDELEPVDLSKYTGENTIYSSKNQIVSDSDSIDVISNKKITSPNKEYTFENFIVGSSNKLAHAAALAVANNNLSNTLKEYNPLFIYGQSGLGKTHLLYAITNRVLEKNPTANILYVKCEEFLNELVESITNHKPQEFRDKFRNVNMLLIDDIQFISGKEQTQEEFFNTFNSLYEDGKQIIMTSDRPPRDIQRLEDRLRTRFEWGQIADIQSPSFELRTAILRKKAENQNIEISDEIFTYLAEKLTNNVRQLEGSLKRIIAHYYLGEDITLTNVEEWVSDMITKTPKSEVTIEKIFSIVSQSTGISEKDIKSRQRSADIANARHICVYLISKMTDLSIAKISNIFQRDHSTINNSIKNIENEIKNDAEYEKKINELIAEIIR